VASGTLLSVGAVDPRGKTEKNLETPRMFFSQAELANEVYFRPGKIPAVTVNAPIETETVKLSDSVDPRRAKTIPRLDRAPLPPSVVDSEPAYSEHAVARSPQSIPDLLPPESTPWHGDPYAMAPASIPSDHDGQIHASLSHFRDDGAASFSLQGVPTRAEPLAGRRASDLPPVSEPALPDPSTVATHRDLPWHRIQASTPPPPSVDNDKVTQRALPTASGAPAPASEGPTPTTASIAAAEPARPSTWQNYVAFLAALIIALLVGSWWTQRQQTSPEAPSTARVVAPPREQGESTVAPAPRPPSPRPTAPPAVELAPPVAPARPAPRREGNSSVLPPSTSPGAPAPRASNPAKSVRETIF
jgi:hypothetical protein